MALRMIRDERDPILRKKSKEVREVTPRIKELTTDMLDTMYHANGVGLAAPQVGILKRVIVVDIEPEMRDPHVFINPQIIEQEGACMGQEGCLSVPNRVGEVERPTRIRLRYLDLAGQEQELEAEDFFARAICHEVDHLEGILFIDHPEFVPVDPEDPGVMD
ncbi:Peptide deformylase [Clostridiaceae bacterium JG1575]|nr:Peptide deformylase [Clostridiaceae bacterium JG1575]